jgi:hypothetical protein
VKRTLVLKFHRENGSGTAYNKTARQVFMMNYNTNFFSFFWLERSNNFELIKIKRHWSSVTVR